MEVDAIWAEIARSEREESRPLRTTAGRDAVQGCFLSGHAMPSAKFIDKCIAYTCVVRGQGLSRTRTKSRLRQEEMAEQSTEKKLRQEMPHGLAQADVLISRSTYFSDLHPKNTPMLRTWTFLESLLKGNGLLIRGLHLELHSLITQEVRVERGKIEACSNRVANERPQAQPRLCR